MATALREPMSVLLIAAAAVSGLLAGETAEAIAILVVVALNVAIGVVQEWRAEGALQALIDMQSPTARVIRDGVPQYLPTTHVVPGDAILLAAGDRVCADGRIVIATDLEVDESTLTGESLPLAKAGADPLWSGTMVSRGTATMATERTGEDTKLGRLAKHLERPETETPLQRQLSKLSWRLGLAAMAISVLVFAAISFTSGDWQTAFLTGVALAVAAVPEGLPTAVVLALALGVTRMARRKAIVRRLSAVETLGSATVILTDKTGTLTENRVETSGLITGSGRHFQIGEVPEAISLSAGRIARNCNDATLDPPSGDAIDLGLLRTFVNHGLSSPGRRIAERPFTSQRKIHTVVSERNGAVDLLVKGGPEIVLSMCSQYLSDESEVVPIDVRDRHALLELVEDEARAGSRLIALAERRLTGFDGNIEGLETQLTLVAIVTMRDPVRPTARATINAARHAGIDVLMVTGDHPGTAHTIAVQAGLEERGVITGSDIERDGLPENPRSVSVYARVEPEQKLRVVEALQARGEVVAFKGDGVNDAPALKAADIGVAMGQGGTEVARQAADIIITNDDLETVVSAIEEGRAIYDNIRKVVEYLVGGNLSELIVMIATILLIPAIPVPLLPLQLLFINLVTDGLPALALGVDPGASDLMQRSPRLRGESLLDRRRFLRLVGRGAVMAAGPMIVGASLVGTNGPVEARSAMFITLTLVHLGYALVVRYPTTGPNRMLSAALVGGAGLLGVALAVSPLRELLDLAVPTTAQWTFIAAAAVVPLVALAISMRVGARHQSRI